MRIENQISPLSWPTLQDFFSKCYRSNHAILDREIFAWQYRCEENDPASLVCAWQDEKLVGVLGYLPIRSFWGNFDKPVHIAWAMNWMVDVDHRHGLGLALLRRLEELYPIILSVDASEINTQIVQRMGWALYPPMDRWLYIVNSKKIQIIFGYEEVSSLNHGGADKGRNIWRLQENVREYRPDWFLYGTMKFGAIRDMSFMQWRYFSHPRFQYEVLCAGAKTRPAVCAYHIEYSYDRKGDFICAIGRIADFFYPSDMDGEKDATNLMLGVLSKMHEQKCIFVDFYCAPSKLSDFMHNNGWIKQELNEPLLPSRFMPMDNNHKDLNYEIGTQNTSSLPSPGELYLTKADCDAEMPGIMESEMPENIAKMYKMKTVSDSI